MVTAGAASGPAQLTIRTRFVDSGFPDPVPRGLWVDARGPAASLESAVNEFSNLANFLGSFFAFTTNAWVGEVQAEIAYNATPGLKRREYFQQALPEKSGTLQPARTGNAEATLALMRAVSSHPDSELLQRAIVQYGLSLGHWRPGREVLAVAHLWIGMEALTPIIRYQACRQLQIPKPEWKDAWRAVVEADESLKDSRIRKDILFQGDTQTYKDAAEAMNGYEHGYAAFTAVRKQAVAARDLTASYLRTTIIVLSGLDAQNAGLLVSPEFIEPFDAVPMSKYLRGTLISDTDELAAKTQAYPRLHWTTKLIALTRTKDGHYNTRFNERYVAELGEGVSFQAESFEIWGPSDAKKARKADAASTFQFQVEHNIPPVPITSEDHAKDVLEAYRTANVSPSFTSEKLASGTFSDRVDVFEDQIRGWWLSKAYALDPTDDNAAHAILPIAVAVMVAIERYRQGKPHKGTSALFRDAFQREFHHAPESTGPAARELTAVPKRILEWIEGGVSHRGDVLINERGPLPVRVVGIRTTIGDIEIIEINPKRFLDAVAGAFQTYVGQLRNTTAPNFGELRARFEKTHKMLHEPGGASVYRRMWRGIVGFSQKVWVLIKGHS